MDDLRRMLEQVGQGGGQGDRQRLGRGSPSMGQAGYGRDSRMGGQRGMGAPPFEYGAGARGRRGGMPDDDPSFSGAVPCDPRSDMYSHSPRSGRDGGHGGPLPMRMPSMMDRAQPMGMHPMMNSSHQMGMHPMMGHGHGRGQSRGMSPMVGNGHGAMDIPMPSQMSNPADTPKEALIREIAALMGVPYETIEYLVRLPLREVIERIWDMSPEIAQYLAAKVAEIRMSSDHSGQTRGTRRAPHGWPGH